MAEAIEQGWQRVGAWIGGTVNSVLLLPAQGEGQVALAATAVALFRSTNGGQNWQNCPLGEHEAGVVSLAASGDPQPLLWAATASGGLYSSTDNGQSWREITAWRGLGVATALAISPAYAADNTLFVATAAGIFRSQNGGENWESSTFGLVDLDVLCLACAADFATSGILWAGTAAGGFFRSRNGGRSWRDSGDGLPDMAIQCLALSPHFADDQTLYTGSEADGIYVSNDGGTSWQPLSDDLRGQSINALIVLPAGTGLLAGTGSGLYRSGKDGQDWQLTPAGEFLALALAVDATGALLAGSYADGVYGAEHVDTGWRPINTGLVAHSPPVAQLRGDHTLWLLDMTGALVCSTDWGASWQAQNEAVGNQPVFALATGTKSTAATTATGLWLYTAGEQSWQPRALPTAQATRLLLLSPHYAQDHTLLLGDDEQRLYLSQNDGVDWQALPAPWAGEELLQVAFSPTGDQALLVITVRRGAAGEHYQLQLWRSLPGSVNFRSVNFISLAVLTTELPSVALLWPVDPLERAFFLATQHRVIKLTPRASDGELAATQYFLPVGTNITMLAASPTFAQDGTLYAATNRGLYSSTDGGATWALLDDRLAERLLVAVLPGNEGRLIVVEFGGGIISNRMNQTGRVCGR